MGFETPIIDLTGIAQTAQISRADRTAARAQGPLSDGDVRRVAEEFEAVFISQMLAPVFETVGSDPLFGGGPGEDMYRSMLVEEYGKTIARAGGIGLSDALQREILSLQELAAQ